MAIVLAGNWWSWVLRGLLAILFGILTFIMPGVTLRVLVLLFAGYAFVEGIVNCIAAVRAPKGARRWWVLLLEGSVSVAAGMIAFFNPGISALVLIYLIGAWAIVTGAFEIAAAIRLRKQITGEWLLILSGVLSVLFGALLFFLPGLGALTIALYIGAYAILFGTLMIVLGFRLRRWGANRATVNPAGAPA